MRLFIRMLFALGLLMAVGCRQSDVAVELKRVEGFVDQYPDSALRELDRIDFSDVSADSDKALYGLLLTKAKIKCYEHIDSDSLIAFSSDYFARKGDREHEMESKHFRSLIKFQNGEYVKAVTGALEALDLARLQKNNKYVGLTARTVSDSYIETCNFADALSYAEVAFETFKAGGLQPYLNHAFYDLASAQMINGQTDSALQLIESAKDSAIVYEDSILLVDLERLRGKTLFYVQRYGDAADVFEELCQSDRSECADSGLLVSCCLKLGDIEKAQRYIVHRNTSSDINAALSGYEYCLACNQKDSALFYLKNAFDQANDIFEKKTMQEMSSSVADYYDLERARDRMESRMQRERLLIIVGLLVVLLIAGSVYLYKKQQALVERNVELAMQIQESFNSNTVDSDAYKDTVKALLRSRYTVLDKLCHIVYDSPSGINARKRISDSVTALIENLKLGGRGYQELCDLIDRNCNQIFTRFTADFESLKEQDRGLFVYSFLGFSASTIAVMLGEQSPTAVYGRKRRLKDRIRNSAVSSREEYLAVLGQKL